MEDDVTSVSEKKGLSRRTALKGLASGLAGVAVAGMLDRGGSVAAMLEDMDKSQHIMRVRVLFPDTKSMLKSTIVNEVDWIGRGPSIQEDGRVIGEAYVPVRGVAVLKSKGFDLEVIEDETKSCATSQADVGPDGTDRFAGETIVPNGLGKKEGP